MLSTEALVDFGETLQRHGYPVTSYELIAANRALTALLAAESLPERAAELAPYLAPIFCTTAQQQAEFGGLYRDWARARFGEAANDPVVTAPERLPEPPKPPFARWKLAALVLAIGAAALVAELVRERPLEVAVRFQDGASASAEVRETRTGARADAAPGRPAQLSYRWWHSPLELEISAPGYESVVKHLPRPPRSLEVELARARPEAALAKPESAPLPVAARKSDTPAVQTTLEWRFEPLRVLAMLAFVSVVVGWWLWTTLRRRAWLQRLPRSGEETVRRLRAGSGEVAASLRGALQALVRELRRRRVVPSRELDVGATLSATLRQGGVLAPVYEARVEPDYLFLVDRASLSDTFARLADEIVRGLHERSLSVERFFFDGDPLRARHAALKRGAPDLGAQDLDQLFARFGERQLIVFGDGRGFLDSYTGRRAAWVERLLRWNAPVFITPSPVGEWGVHEWEMERAGFVVLPMNALGLRLLGEVIGRGRVRSPIPAGARLRAGPAYLRDADRLLDHEPPSPEFVARVVEGLRRDLGERTFAWLCGLAVYPELHWGLTLHVGATVFGERSELTERLALLSRLPWLRNGYLPDWLRAALLASFPAGDEARVRSAITAFLERVGAANAQGDELAISTGAPGASAASASEERVFLRFMSGGAPKLAVRATEALRKVFYRGGAALGGANPWAFAVVTVIGLALLAWQFPPMTPSVVQLASATPPAPPLPATSEPAKSPPLIELKPGGPQIQLPLTPAPAKTPPAPAKTPPAPQQEAGKESAKAPASVPAIPEPPAPPAEVERNEGAKSAVRRETIVVPSREAIPRVRVPTQFPPEAARLGLTSGKASARATLDEAGGVTSVRVVRSEPHPAFGEELARALKEWRFNAGAAGRTYDMETTFDAGGGTVAFVVAPWGRVFVDGQDRGVSPPLRSLKLAAGTHEIEVRNAEFPPLVQRIEVKAGEEITIRHRFAATGAAEPEAAEAPSPPVFQGRRVALVIGNNAYPKAPLRNAVNDARDLGSMLRLLGFTVVVRENASRRDLVLALDQFGATAAGADAALFFFAGHGFQSGSRDYLLPVDATPTNEQESAALALDLGEVTTRLARAGAKFNFVVIDANRDLAFGPDFKPSAPGLREPAPVPGTLMAFATSPGFTSSDGFGRNGTYTKHLLREIGKPNVPIEVVLARVRDAVMQETRNQQVPWDRSTLPGDFTFNPTAKPPTGSAPAKTSVGSAPPKSP